VVALVVLEQVMVVAILLAREPQGKVMRVLLKVMLVILLVLEEALVQLQRMDKCLMGQLAAQAQYLQLLVVECFTLVVEVLDFTEEYLVQL
jgi:hypothetical protein